MTPKARGALALEVYNVAFDAHETFADEDKIGAHLCYLLGAILDTKNNDAFVDWSTDDMPSMPALFYTLETAFPKTHPVWKFIRLRAEAAA